MGHKWLEAKSFDLAKRQAKGTSREIAEEKWTDVKAARTPPQSKLRRVAKLETADAATPRWKNKSTREQ